MIPSLLEGYNTSVMLYGVTGSGKTHTVFGDINEETPNEKGIINYALSELFKNLNGKKDVIKISYIEIYNENVKDLLGGGDQNMMVCEDSEGNVKVAGLTQVSIKSFKELLSLIKNGNKKRKMAKTNSNEFSSRSHAIIQINLKIRSLDPRKTRYSKLSFIDLAGSERVSLTENKGLRMTEGSNINRSLLALGNVINKLSSNSIKGGSQYIPYRDSKLTRLLKDSLGGNTKTVLITCITPVLRQIDETIHSLNYATRAKKIKVNIAKNEIDFLCDFEEEGQQKEKGRSSIAKKVENNEVSELKKKIEFLQNELLKERGEKNNVEKTYEQLVYGMEEHLNIKNSIKDIEKMQRKNRGKIQILEDKKQKMINLGGGNHELGKLIEQQISNLQEIIKENEEVKFNLEERLNEIIEEREYWLSKGETSVNAARSKSPIIHRNSMKGSEIFKKAKKQPKKRQMVRNHYSTSNIFEQKDSSQSIAKWSDLIEKRKNRDNYQSCVGQIHLKEEENLEEYHSRRSRKRNSEIHPSPILKENIPEMAKSEIIILTKNERKTEKKKTLRSDSSVQDTTYILKSNKKQFLENGVSQSDFGNTPNNNFSSIKKGKTESLHINYLETVKGNNNNNNPKFNLLSESKGNFEFCLEVESEQKNPNPSNFVIRTEPPKQNNNSDFKFKNDNLSDIKQSKENLKNLIMRLNSEKEFQESKKDLSVVSSRSISQKRDYGNLPLNLQKKKKAKFLNTETLQMESLTNNLKLLQENLNEFRNVVNNPSKYSQSTKDLSIQPILDKNQSNASSNDFCLPTPLHPSKLESRENSPKIQKKLDKARKKMRDFKKKLITMKTFLNKYGNRSISKNRGEIYQAVSVLIDQQFENRFKLNSAEEEAYEEMLRFKEAYERKWGSYDFGYPVKIQGSGRR